jgi:hypothetical protein
MLSLKLQLENIQIGYLGRSRYPKEKADGASTAAVDNNITADTINQVLYSPYVE